jgi:hypothetical protein
MPTKKYIARRKDKITVSSSKSDADNHKLLGIDQEYTSKAQAMTHYMGSSIIMPQRRGGSFHNKIHLPTSTRPSKRTTF